MSIFLIIHSIWILTVTNVVITNTIEQLNEPEVKQSRTLKQ